MPTVLPFRALRPVATGETLAARLSPPYDVIAPEERARLARDPHNPVHVILPEGEGDERYQRAARILEGWREEGALVRDPAPGFYAYEQAFSEEGAARTRSGLFGLLELRGFDEGGVFAHEQTLDAPKEDRFRLLSATRTNLSPVFVLYEDRDGDVARVLEKARAASPAASATGPAGPERLWPLTGRHDTAALARALSAGDLVFADGHHRYEAALRYRDHQRALDPEAAYPQAWDFLPACFVDAHDPGLLILATHRVLHGVAPVTAESLEARLEPGLFHRRSLGRPASPADAEARAREFLAGRPRGAFVFVTGGEVEITGFTLAREARGRAFARSEVPPALRELDVSVLHALVLGPGFGLTAERLAAQSNLEYVKSAASAAAAVLERHAACAFLLAPTPVGQVLAVARAGGRMPQKSTYFVPKLTTGWLYHAHASPEEVWGSPPDEAPWWPGRPRPV